MINALIDADIVAYRCAAASQNDTLADAVARCDNQIESIIGETNATHFSLYLTGSNNFRRKLSPTYKANRTQEKPQFLEDCRDFLIKNWKAVIATDCEADDLLGINQDEHSIICSIDKDLLQVPGKHYNFIKKEFQEVSYLEGMRAFYLQMITGDTSDNIKGVQGLGKVKGAKVLDSTSPDMWYQKVRELYSDDERFEINAKLLWIIRTSYPDGIWSIEDSLRFSSSYNEDDRDLPSGSVLERDDLDSINVE